MNLVVYMYDLARVPWVSCTIFSSVWLVSRGHVTAIAKFNIIGRTINWTYNINNSYSPHINRDDLHIGDGISGLRELLPLEQTWKVVGSTWELGDFIVWVIRIWRIYHLHLFTCNRILWKSNETQSLQTDDPSQTASSHSRVRCWRVRPLQSYTLSLWLPPRLNLQNNHPRLLQGILLQKTRILLLLPKGSHCQMCYWLVYPKTIGSLWTKCKQQCCYLVIYSNGFCVNHAWIDGSLQQTGANWSRIFVSVHSLK